ncbi:hypothetical protein SISSUDRAFT_1052915 [Sistotremastrum suecicum HHB10207 ss-3]|uniref:Uncharacterized protein n=1 Tax=Sistotremastrum suecicum HHB10207 ss-3 TaxID=1314776 RepID=A0A165ZJK1_9AGAM|nr:hypothetical protein SISSUDRAFT_1052915 [Sistotremastrum suecicum HHB10207 ss-3]
MSPSCRSREPTPKPTALVIIDILATFYFASCPDATYLSPNVFEFILDVYKDNCREQREGISNYMGFKNASFLSYPCIGIFFSRLAASQNKQDRETFN